VEQSESLRHKEEKFFQKKNNHIGTYLTCSGKYCIVQRSPNSKT